MCPSVENPDLVCQETGDSQSLTHPRPAEHDSRQTIQTRPDHSNRMVPPSRVLPSNMQLVAPASSGSVCHEVQQQTAPVCITGFRPTGLGCRCTQSVLGRSGPLCLPTGCHPGQSGGEVAGLPMQQNDPDCSRVAQHDLVLGLGGNVQPDPLCLPNLPSLLTQPFNQTLHWNLLNLKRMPGS